MLSILTGRRFLAETVIESSMRGDEWIISHIHLVSRWTVFKEEMLAIAIVTNNY